MIDQSFVCKKYDPYDSAERAILFENFAREIKLMHKLHHINVVRVFNYYLYRDTWKGYIFMEHVDGLHVDKYAASNPECLNSLFLQALEGFEHLEANDILHRDIRHANLMVTGNGQVKIIDLGFGKHVASDKDFDKSIRLNWAFDPPEEIDNSQYFFATEVYFVGKLFEEILTNQGITDFAFTELLRRMCVKNLALRIGTFAEALQIARQLTISETSFTDYEKMVYQNFAATLCSLITKIKGGATYREDLATILDSLSTARKNSMLEEYVSGTSAVIGTFINGDYYYRTRSQMRVETLVAFYDLLRACSPARASIVLANLYDRLNNIERYEATDEIGDPEIPF